MLILAFDVVNQVFVPSHNGSAAVLPKWRQARYDLQIYLVQPSATAIPGTAQYEAANPTDYAGIRVGIWSDSTGTADDSGDHVLALTVHQDFTYNTDDADYPYFSGTLNTNTEEMAEHIGSANNAAAYFAINLVKLVDDAITLEPILDHSGSTNTTIYSATDDANGVLPITITGAAQRVPAETVYGPFSDGTLWQWVGVYPTLTFTCINPP